MDIEIKKERGVCVIECAGRLTLGKGEITLRRNLMAALEDGERFLVFDLTGVTYIDSAGVGEIVACAKRAFEKSGVIKIVLSPEGTVRRIFDMTYLDRAFEVFTDRAQAIASFSD